MRNKLRSFLLCLIIASLPVKSLAGIASYACGMMHSSSVRIDARQGITQKAAITSGTHEHNHERAEVSARSTTSSDQDCEDMDGPACSGCGTCASCCIGAYAPPPAMRIVGVQDVAISNQQFSLSSFTGHTPARIERPPRA